MIVWWSTIETKLSIKPKLFVKEYRLFSHSVNVKVFFSFFQGPRYRALYDYTAADEDEITINEGDIIVEANIIDSGWMEGRNERTGMFGMLPSNYVEEI